MRKNLILIVHVLLAITLFGQNNEDSIKSYHLDPVTIEHIRNIQDIQRLPQIQGTYVFAGKKNEVIVFNEQSTGLSEKYGRQIFAKVPGVFVYDMDGTGNQVNISTRGLDPHRGWEFNIRKDGIITNTDMYGYPASHYNVPMEALERIELVRGTAAQQYGGQFGGMINYVTKQPDTRKIGFESINTAGSYGLVSTFNRMSGTVGKFRYAAWFNKKASNGYRTHGDSQYEADGITLFYDFNENLSLQAEYTHSNYVIHLAGALTDAQFKEDPRQATRSRNYYNPDIHVPSIVLDWKVNAQTTLKLTSSAVIGARNSVMFDKPTNVADTIVTETLQYNNRQVDIDDYLSVMNEIRLLQNYSFFKQTNALTVGIQLINNDLHRKQQGVGTTGSDYDLTLVKEGWGRDLHFITNNVALFVENKWSLTNRFSINTAGRMELGKSKLSGVINNYPDEALPNTIDHSYPTFGVSAEYAFDKSNVYGGWSQAYRPVILKDIIPGSLYEHADKNLKDAFGYNAEVGYRGQRGFMSWDVTAFYIKYQNRLGTLAQTDAAGNLIIYRTNIGDSQTKGVEVFLQGDWVLNPQSSLSVFTASTWMDAHYVNATIRSGNENIYIDGNKVESVPEIISRCGTTYKYGRWHISVLFSYTAESYADALNARQPNATASVGIVPAYSLLDVSCGVSVNSRVKLSLNVSNLTDQSYFTKRPQFYPGPGIWPSDGRSVSGTIAIKI